MKRNMLLASTSTVFGSPYLSYLLDEIESLFAGVRQVLFIPYARPGGMTCDEYTAEARKVFLEMGKGLSGIHEHGNPEHSLMQAEAVFAGGGNTFVLLHSLLENGLMGLLRDKILSGMPYLGTSAGSNICGPGIKTTNDMPIVYPRSFEALGVIPFNINPHYLDPVEGLEHMGETRETRIKEYLVFNDIPVLGMREGAWLRIRDGRISLSGNADSRWFEPGKTPVELPPGTLMYDAQKRVI